MEFKGKIPNVIDRQNEVTNLSASCSLLRNLIDNIDRTKIDPEGMYPVTEVEDTKNRYSNKINALELRIEELNKIQKEEDFASQVVNIGKEIQELKKRLEKIGN